MGNAPKLRFEGFPDAWEQRKLGEFCQQLSATLNPQERPDDVFVEYSMPAFDNGERPDVVLGDTMSSARKTIDRPCLLINKLNVRKKRIWNVKNPEKNAVSSTEFVAVYSDKIDLTFLKYLVSNDSFTSYLEDCSSGSSNSQKRVTPDVIMSAILVVPSKDEQLKIGGYLEGLDTLITLHQRKCDALTKAKTFYLQNLLPQEGEKEPRLRLEGFTDSWNPYTLGDLYTERNERGNETLQILTVSIHTGVSDGALEEDELGKSVRRSEDKTLYKHVYAGDLIFNMMRAWQGAIGVAKREGMISPAYISAIPDERVFPPFMNYLLRRKEIISQINNLSYGVTDFRKRLYWDSFIKVKCSLPSVEEQKCITDVFEQLDTLITRQEHRIKVLKTMKKFMLQNMFPQEG